MVQPAFDIGNSQAEDFPADSRLLIEISGQSLNYILYNEAPRRLLLLRQYRMYTTSERSASDLLDEIVSGDPILQRFSASATVVYNFPVSNLLPDELYDPSLDEAVSRLIYGDRENDLVFNEPVKDMDMRNVYCAPRQIHQLCKSRFKGGRFWHFYTILLCWSQQDAVRKGNFIRVVFYNDKFIAAFFRESQLQLIQTFFYQTPEDAAYYLLLICRQFGVPPTEMVLCLSGLIDSQSALYTELLKYFSEVQCESLPDDYDTDGLLAEYPSHYFSPLLKMSLCV